jgi:hypothetical protein
MGMLPTQRTPIIREIDRYKTLIYGQSKAGKTTFASTFPNAVFLATEPGAQALETYQVPINSWTQFLAATKEISAGEHGFKTVVVDTIDILWKLRQDHVLKSMGIQMLPEEDFGRISNVIKGEFHFELAKLASLPYGLVFISHDIERKIKPKTRLEPYTQISPSLPDAPRKIVTAMVDWIFYLEVEQIITDNKMMGGVVRRLRTVPGCGYDAGGRFPGGQFPDPMEPTYAALLAAFHSSVSRCPESEPIAPMSAPESTTDNPPEPPARPTVPTPVSRRRG